MFVHDLSPLSNVNPLDGSNKLFFPGKHNVAGWMENATNVYFKQLPFVPGSLTCDFANDNDRVDLTWTTSDPITVDGASVEGSSLAWSANQGAFSPSSPPFAGYMCVDDFPVTDIFVFNKLGFCFNVICNLSHFVKARAVTFAVCLISFKKLGCLF